MIALSSGTSTRIIDTANNQTLNIVNDLKQPVTAPTWSPSGDELAIPDGNQVQIWQQPWSSQNAHLIQTLRYDDIFYVSAMAWSPDGKQIAVAKGGDSVDLWDAETGQLNLSFSAHKDTVLQIAWRPDGKQVATVGRDFWVKIWNMPAGTLSQSMLLITYYNLPPSEDQGVAFSVSWNPQGNKLALGVSDGTVRIWDLTALTAQEVTSDTDGPISLKGHAEPVMAVAWNPAGQTIASGSEDGTVRIWDASTWQPLQVIQTGAPVYSISWDSSGQKIAYGTGNANPAVYEAFPAQTPVPTETVAPASEG